MCFTSSFTPSTNRLNNQHQANETREIQIAVALENSYRLSFQFSCGLFGV